ncbi:disease resistance protein PIK6-NP-like [Phragmites australis]|uniref:disease resistance protein PIK6-NP-like n=1 Tax=Phragmites australis TaxID=29695 RepID=UPI002D7A0C62|nr:disease resistance protein PIK6-NP-like [Phragmites australis]
MADQTHSAVDSLLGLLTGAIKDEARLLGGVQGDIQFIKDEMDSMNGFLLHLTKMETEHDDQLRAWMKQVRDIAYIAQDCMEVYMHDLSPPESGFWALISHLPVLLRTAPARRRLAIKIRELKDRVREVGKRRLRYDITVPAAKPKPKPVSKDSTTDEKREDFLRALEVEDDHRSTGVPSPSFSTAIHLLPCNLPTDAGPVIEKIRVKCVPDHVQSMKMLLRALYAYPHGTKEELESLEDKLNGKAADVPEEVMVFCYSKLYTHYKSCLQYLTAFLEEDSISRTSLVRRWVAEGLLARDEGLQTMEEAGERCFNELVFRGFVCPATPVATGQTIKSCNMESSVRDFVVAISKSENFVSGALPTHFRYQIDIRKIARGRGQPPQKAPLQRQRPWNIWDGLCAVPREPQQDDDDGKLHPMDMVVQKLKNLPEEYRLNVLDLGGCTGLKKRHLKSICKVLSLKYLSLRNTDVSRLPRAINNLRKLETLDVRQTDLRPSDTAHIVLPNLKHLLAGSIRPAGDEIESLSTVQMPRKIGRSMEILRHVQILDGKVELHEVGHLKQLRKLGVVLSGSEDNIKHLLRTISKLSECLRSLSVWITAPPPMAGDGGGVTLDNKDGTDGISSSPPKYLESLNIKYFKGTSTSGSLPPWIEGLKLLSNITLRDTQLSANGLRILGKLESLCCLRLRRDSYTEDNISLKKGEFQKLQFLLIDQVCPTIRIAFEADAAPKLQRVVWTFDKNKKMEIMAGTISGIDNLRSLKELELNGDWIDRQDYVNQALAAHPEHPLLRCSFPDSSPRQ